MSANGVSGHVAPPVDAGAKGERRVFNSVLRYLKERYGDAVVALDVPAPPGREERIAGVITSILGEMGYAWEQDGAGNLTVRIEGRNPTAGTLLFSAHMDEIGAAERVATIGQVRENSHGFELARLSVFDNLYKALVQFLKTWE